MATPVNSLAGSDEFRAIQSQLAAWRVDATNAYCLLSNQSGDIGHVLAALTVEAGKPAAFIIVVREDDPRGTASMGADFAACRFPGNVHLLPTPPLPKDRAILLYAALTLRDNGILQPPTSATQRAQQKVRQLRILGPIRREWLGLLYADNGMDTPLAREILDYCRSKSIDAGRPTVCLWSRHSKLTGANPQFDSSNLGMAAILDNMPGGFQLLLIGSQCDKVVRHLRRPAIVLGEYWRESPFNNLSRIEQNVLFYVLLSSWQCPLVQIGMKSGQMDMLALWGLPTVIIEDLASPTKTRTEYWTGKGGEVKKDKPGVQTAVFVSKLPTTKGQAIRALGEERQTPSLTEESRVEVERREKLERDRGFETEDLGMIVDRTIVQMRAAEAALTLKNTADRLRTLKEDLPGFGGNPEDF